jgi:hypothetical protein
MFQTSVRGPRPTERTPSFRPVDIGRERAAVGQAQVWTWVTWRLPDSKIARREGSASFHSEAEGRGTGGQLDSAHQRRPECRIAR